MLVHVRDNVFSFIKNIHDGEKTLFAQHMKDAVFLIPKPSHLKNKAYVATIRKQEPKFYILDIGKTYSVLKNHGLNVTPVGSGRVHHLD